MSVILMVATIGLLVSLFLLVYPFLVYPLLLRVFPKGSGVEPVETDGPKQTFALLLCARNEADVLPATLARLRMVKAGWPELDIIAYDDASTDATNTMLQGASAFLTPLGGKTQRGKAAGIRRMLEVCTADVVLFMDANVLVMAQDMLRFKTHFADPTVGAVGCRLLYAVREDSTSAKVGGAYWKLEEKIKGLETATGSMMGCDGALWGMRRAIYPIFDGAESDDFRPSMQAIFEGYRVVSAPDIRGVEVLDQSVWREFRRKIRVSCGAWHAHRTMRPQLARMGVINKLKYLSHKWLRWFSAVWLGLTLVFAGVLAAAASGLVIYGAMLLLGLGLAALKVRPFAQCAQIALAMVATLWGVVIASRGHRRETWSPARAQR